MGNRPEVVANTPKQCRDMVASMQEKLRAEHPRIAGLSQLYSLADGAVQTRSARRVPPSGPASIREKTAGAPTASKARGSGDGGGARGDGKLRAFCCAQALITACTLDATYARSDELLRELRQRVDAEDPSLALTDLDDRTQASSALFDRYLRQWEPLKERFDKAIRSVLDIEPYLLGPAARNGL